MRLFVAIDFPKRVAHHVHTICCGVPGARWVAPEQLHLTLRFVDKVDDGLFSSDPCLIKSFHLYSSVLGRREVSYRLGENDESNTI